MTKAIEKIFEAVKEAVLAEGGDGDGYIISNRYSQLAAEFNDDWFREKRVYEDCVVFSNYQEHITFRADREVIPWIPAIIVEYQY